MCDYIDYVNGYLLFASGQHLVKFSYRKKSRAAVLSVKLMGVYILPLNRSCMPMEWRGPWLVFWAACAEVWGSSPLMGCMFRIYLFFAILQGEFATVCHFNCGAILWLLADTLPGCRQEDVRYVALLCLLAITAGLPPEEAVWWVLTMSDHPNSKVTGCTLVVGQRRKT